MAAVVVKYYRYIHHSGDIMAHKLHEIAENWLEHSQPYRPSAFWFWNADMNEQRMTEVVSEMAKNGIREFLIHPVHGMTVPYLSDDYFHRYRFALGLAKQYGLGVWVYDEFGWPSGVAGGLLLRNHPEYNGWFLQFDHDADGNVTAKPVHPDVQLDNTLGAPWTQNELGYVDTLSVDAMNCFIQMTHQRVYDECGELFHDVIRGFFTDEPTTMVINEKRLAGCWNTMGLPWTPTFPARFKQMHGYDIEPHYTELAGEAPCQYREHYWAVVKQMHVEAYHKQMADWCHAHGVMYTGHLGENSMLMQAKFAGSAYQCLSHMDEPGIDYLGMMPEPEDVFIEQALVPSIARHSGHERVYCEAYGISHYDLRLSDMLQRAQMFGINGVNDIALMGFHQGLSGVRKRTYWPPLFHTCPWWEFYPQFRDAFARSVALPNLGSRKVKYAIVYPQYQLEQNNPFQTGFGAPDEPVMPLTESICQAIYAAGENFEFVFPEMIDQAEVKDGRVVYPYTEYDALIAPTDFAYFDQTNACLQRIANQQGCVMQASAEDIIGQIKSASPSWNSKISLKYDAPEGSIRVHRYLYDDGELYALRNTTDQPISFTVDSSQTITEWQPVSGCLSAWVANSPYVLDGHRCAYLSVTDKALPAQPCIQDGRLLPIDAHWQVEPEAPNTASLAHMEFRGEQGDWLPAVNVHPFVPIEPRNCTGIPAAFRGQSQFEMRSSFECDGVPSQIGLVFEPEYLRSLVVNGHNVELCQADCVELWDKLGCIDISGLIKLGTNTVSACLEYPAWETSVHNDAFFEADIMPSCDMVLYGPFRVINGAITFEAAPVSALPISLEQHGWEQYMGIIELKAEAELPSGAGALVLEPIMQDSMELLVDGVSLGKRITAPYRFTLPEGIAGKHQLTIRLSSTSSNLLYRAIDWGIVSASVELR